MDRFSTSSAGLFGAVASGASLRLAPVSAILRVADSVIGKEPIDRQTPLWPSYQKP